LFLSRLMCAGTAAYEAVIAENKTLRALNDDLAAQLETLKRKFFGRSSEKQMADDQPQLFDEPVGEQPDDVATDSDDETTIVRPHTRKKNGRTDIRDLLTGKIYFLVG
jgi:hypothetical protein